ncbi:MAG TPA: hypothetical protein VNC11_05255 [Gemmatimonadaceae bacterium]|jgi:hypothetical protein|nr:hypothetical protein [Gemmatimonadaceae bacterium]
MRSTLKKFVFLVVVSSLVAVMPGKTNAQAADVARAKAALAKYADPILAVKDGYYSTVACVDFPKGAKDGPIEYPPGAMGIHFLNLGNVGPTLDPTKPQVLIYERGADGKLKLTAAEWFMPEQVAAGKTPMIFGQKLAGPMNGHEPIMPASLRHYDLHVWMWKNNPRGMFTSTNAAVKCKKDDPYTVALGSEHEHMH